MVVAGQIVFRRLPCSMISTQSQCTHRSATRCSLISLQCDSSIDQAGMLKITRREFKVKSSLTSSDGSTNNQTTHHHYERNICSTNQFRRGRTTWHCPSPAALAESLSGGER